MKKKRRKSWIKKVFGRRFALADVILITLIIGYPAYILFTQGFKKIIEDFAGQIWAGIFVGYVVYTLIRRARR